MSVEDSLFDEAYEQLIEILKVAIARGEKLGYADEDYRQLLERLKGDD